jgi:hypothetical protein
MIEHPTLTPTASGEPAPNTTGGALVIASAPGAAP